MPVRIKLPRYLQEKTTAETPIEVEGATVRECIDALVQRYPQLKGEILDSQGTVLLKWTIYINDHSVPVPDELSHLVKHGDTITLLPVVAGG